MEKTICISISVINDYDPSIPTELVYSFDEIESLNNKLINTFKVEESWLNSLSKSKSEESITCNLFSNNCKRSFLFVIKSIHFGRLLSATNRHNIKDIADVCMKLGLTIFVKQISLDADSYFEVRLNDIDRKFVATEKTLRKKLFSNEEKNYRPEDSDFLLENLLKDSRLAPIERELFTEPGIYVNNNTLYPTLYTKEKDLPKTITLESISEVANLGKVRIIQILKYCPLVFDGTFVIAGGSVNTCLTIPGNELIDGNNIADIDIFFITKDQKEAEKSMYHNILRIIEVSKIKLILRTENSITIQLKRDHDHGWCNLKIQFILRLYNSIAQVISGFDIDACCVAYDGEQFYGMPRYLRSVNKGYILVDPERQSETYGVRLLKYYKRGFDIALPGYDESRVVNYKEGIDYIVRKITSIQNNLYMHISDYDASGFNPTLGDLKSSGYANAIYCKVGDFPSEDSSDGPLNRPQIDFRHQGIIIPIIMSKSITKIFTGKETKKEKQIFALENFDYPHRSKDDYSYKRMRYYQNELAFESNLGILTFKTKNAGTQLTNSFRPVFSDWYKDAYIRRIKNISPNCDETTMKAALEVSQKRKYVHKKNIFTQERKLLRDWVVSYTLPEEESKFPSDWMSPPDVSQYFQPKVLPPVDIPEMKYPLMTSLSGLTNLPPSPSVTYHTSTPQPQVFRPHLPQAIPMPSSFTSIQSVPGPNVSLPLQNFPTMQGFPSLSQNYSSSYNLPQSYPSSSSNLPQSYPSNYSSSLYNFPQSISTSTLSSFQQNSSSYNTLPTIPLPIFQQNYSLPGMQPPSFQQNYSLPSITPQIPNGQMFPSSPSSQTSNSTVPRFNRKG